MSSPAEVEKYGFDKNLASRVFEAFPKIYGEKGRLFIGGYQYLAWIDDQIDENVLLSISQKREFLDRQLKLVRGDTPENLSPFESLFLNLPWQKVPAEQVRKQVEIILYGIKDDLDSMPLHARSRASIRHTEWRTAIATLRIGSLILNDTDFYITARFAKLMEFWAAKDNVNHFYEDLGFGVLKLPVDPTLEQKLDTIDMKGKKRVILQLFSPQELASLQWVNLAGMIRFAPSIFETNLTASQKLALWGYLAYIIGINSIKNLKRGNPEGNYLKGNTLASTPTSPAPLGLTDHHQ